MSSIFPGLTTLVHVKTYNPADGAVKTPFRELYAFPQLKFNVSYTTVIGVFQDMVRSFEVCALKQLSVCLKKKKKNQNFKKKVKMNIPNIHLDISFLIEIHFGKYIKI